MERWLIIIHALENYRPRIVQLSQDLEQSTANYFKQQLEYTDELLNKYKGQIERRIDNEASYYTYK